MVAVQQGGGPRRPSCADSPRLKRTQVLSAQAVRNGWRSGHCVRQEGKEAFRSLGRTQNCILRGVSMLFSAKRSVQAAASPEACGSRQPGVARSGSGAPSRNVAPPPYNNEWGAAQRGPPRAVCSPPSCLLIFAYCVRSGWFSADWAGSRSTSAVVGPPCWISGCAQKRIREEDSLPGVAALGFLSSWPAPVSFGRV